MKHFFYKTTNNINGKYYIGKHSTTDINDSYLGSGLLLTKAISKYGRESFSRDILCYAHDEDYLNLLEAKYITLDILGDQQCYNIAEGGQGGHVYKHLPSEEKEIIYQKISKTLKEKGIRPPGRNKGFNLTEEHKTSISKSLKGKTKPERSIEHCNNISKALSNRTLSTVQKEKISSSMKEHHSNNKTLECPHCGKKGKSGVMKRWHFDNCRVDWS